MSVDDSASTTTAVQSPDTPLFLQSASYMGCRFCEEGSLVYDPEAGASRCRACGKLD